MLDRAFVQCPWPLLELITARVSSGSQDLPVCFVTLGMLVLNFPLLPHGSRMAAAVPDFITALNRNKRKEQYAKGSFIIKSQTLSFYGGRGDLHSSLPLTSHLSELGH